MASGTITKNTSNAYYLSPGFLTDWLNKPWFPWILSGLYFVIMAYISFTYHTIGDYGVETDFFNGYAPQAQKFLDGKVPIDAFRGPVYPIALALVSFMTGGDLFHAGILLNLLSGTLVIFFTYKLIKDLWRADIALFTALILACNTYFIQYTYSAGTDLLFFALALATLYVFLSSKNASLLSIVLTGALAGIVYITRYNGIFLIIGILLSLLVINPFSLDWKNRIIKSGLILFAFLIVSLPYGVYTLNEKGALFYNQNYKNVAYEFLAKDKMSWDEFWKGDGVEVESVTDVMLEDPGAFFSTVIANAIDHLKKDLGFEKGESQLSEGLLLWPIGILFLGGLLLLFFNHPDKRQLSFILFNVLFFGVLLLVFYNERFSLFLIPGYVAIACVPLISQKYGAKNLLKNNRAGSILLALLFAWTVIESQSFNSEVINSAPQDLRKAIEWFERNGPKNTEGLRISARKPHIGFYTDMKYIPIPYVKNYPDFISKLNEKEVDYLFFGAMEAGTRRPVQALIDPRNAPQKDLKALYYSQNPPFVIYKVIRTNK